jgi:hypothetical protein
MKADRLIVLFLVGHNTPFRASGRCRDFREWYRIAAVLA